MKNRIPILFMLAISATVLQAQELHTDSNRALKQYNAGMEAFHFLNFDQALQHLSEAVSIDSGFYEAYMVMGDINKDLRRFEKAKYNYRKAIAIDSLFYVPAFYHLATCEINTGEYEKARRNFQLYLQAAEQRSSYRREALKSVRDCDFALNAMKNPLDFQPVNLGPQINTERNEYWPSVTADGQLMVFTVLVGDGRPTIPGGPQNQGQEDFYYSKKEAGVWSPAQTVGSNLNTYGNEGAQSLSADGFSMYYTACDRRDGFGSCDIYYSRQISGQWNRGKNVGRPVNSAYWETQPSISPDGQTLYFASNRPGGKGGMDLWLSRMKADGSWSEPLNLGDSINTSYDEMSPFIHPDNKTLYFSSKGRPGMGGFDLYYARKTNDTIWYQVRNLGYPINSHADELGLVLEASGETAYYSSAVDDRRGKDIFSFEMPESIRPDMVTYMKGKVFDKNTGQLLSARFELINLETGEKVMDSFSDQNGSFLVCLPTDMNYALNVNREAYLFYSRNIPLKGVHSVEKPYLTNIALSPLEQGEVLVLNNVFFDFNSSALLPESQLELDRLFALLEENPGISIEVGGHTDSVGEEAYNQLLSERRAESVYQYLLEKGLEAGRLSYKGYGESRPAGENETADGRKLNRRTEITITAVN